MQTSLKMASTAFLVFFSYAEINAQSKKKDDSFPTYDQIRGDRKEIVDYVSPNGGKSTSLIVRKTTIGPQFNALAYDEDSVTYILNGKKVKNKKKAEYEVNRKDIRVERVAIGEVGKDGKRVIEIDYEPFKE